MPVYDLAALAEAFDADTRQIDNLLSRNEIAGVERGARGVTRRVSLEAAVTIRIALDLSAALKVPFGQALSVAARLAAGDGDLRIGKFATLSVDIAAARRATVEQLDDAVETVGKRRRGRPPKVARGDV